MSRLARLEELERAVKQYVAAEKTRIDNEVSVLEAILQGRTGGQGVQSITKRTISSVAKANIASYLAV